MQCNAGHVGLDKRVYSVNACLPRNNAFTYTCIAAWNLVLRPWVNASQVAFASPNNILAGTSDNTFHTESRGISSPRSWHIEHRVWHIGVSRGHATLHDDRLLALPSMKYWHTCGLVSSNSLGLQNRLTCYRAVRFHCDRVYCIVSPNHKREIRVWEVIIDLVHL